MDSPALRQRERRPSLLNDFLAGSVIPGGMVARPLSIDVEEHDDCYRISADVPGAKKEAIDVTVVDDVVTIAVTQNHETERKEEGRYVYRERSNTCASRSVALAHMDADSVQAELKDGVLTLTVKKDEKRLPRKIEVH